MECREFQRHVSRLMDSELDHTTTRGLEEHLERCATCRSFHATAVALNDKLQALPRPAPHPTLSARVMAAIAQTEARDGQTSAFPLWSRVPLMALVVLLAVGMGNLAGRSIGNRGALDLGALELELAVADVDHPLADLIIDPTSEENGQ